MWGRSLIVLFAAWIVVEGAGQTHIILDVDPTGLCNTGLDVDDDLAVIAALADPALNVLGVTTTFGNGPQTQTHADAQALLRMVGREDIKVYKGASWLARFPFLETNASRFILDTLRRHEAGTVTLVSLGAMSNLAAAASQDPETFLRAKEIVAMGGDINNDARHHMHDLNIVADRNSAEIVMKSNVPKRLMTIQTCIQTAITPDFLATLKSQCCPQAAVCEMMKRMEHHVAYAPRWVNPSLARPAYDPYRTEDATKGFFPWDIVAVFALTRPALLSDWREFHAESTGWGLTTSPATGAATNYSHRISVPLKLDSAGFLSALHTSLCSVHYAHPELAGTYQLHGYWHSAWALVFVLTIVLLPVGCFWIRCYCEKCVKPKED